MSDEDVIFDDDDDDDNLVDKAFANLSRNDDDEIDEAEAVEYIAARIVIDVAAEQRRRAIQMLRARRRHGITKADGQLCFPGMEPYDYEPERLVLGEPDDEGRVGLVENRRAKPAAKNAEARRAQRNAVDAVRQAQRRVAEASSYSDWAMSQTRAGTEWVDIAFDRCVAWLRSTDNGGEAA